MLDHTLHKIEVLVPLLLVAHQAVVGHQEHQVATHHTETPIRTKLQLTNTETPTVALAIPKTNNMIAKDRVNLATAQTPHSGERVTPISSQTEILIPVDRIGAKLTQSSRSLVNKGEETITGQLRPRTNKVSQRRVSMRTRRSSLPMSQH